MKIRTMTIATLAGAAAIAAAPQTLAETPHMCGGIGLDAQAAELKQPHTLRIEYADKSGKYLGDVLTQIETGDGKTVVDLECDGPWVLANLPTGTYKVRSEMDGEAKTNTVRVDGRSTRNVVIRF